MAQGVSIVLVFLVTQTNFSSKRTNWISSAKVSVNSFFCFLTFIYVNNAGLVP